jgi:GNAT superfamily N-acetyltransferase
LDKDPDIDYVAGENCLIPGAIHSDEVAYTVAEWLDFPDPEHCHTLLPARGFHPYYIVTPHYQRNSIGVRCLHLLVHWLNRLGHSAWILSYTGRSNGRTNPDLITPELTPAVYAHHRSLGLSPIVVYPETVIGNPLRASVVARYVLNFPGLLGGDRTFHPREIAFGFASALSAAVGSPENVLHMPALDTELFSPEPAVPRDGTCFYLGKYREVHGGEAFGLPPGSVEIPRDPEAMDQATIAALFRRSELLYAYENTGLVTEACLCDCPVVMMPNPWLSGSIADKELGWDGVAWGDAAEEIARAKATVGLVRQRYQRTVSEFFPQLDRFVGLTQARARETPDAAALDFRALGCRSMSHWFTLPKVSRLRLSLDYRVRGWRNLLGAFRR